MQFEGAAPAAWTSFDAEGTLTPAGLSLWGVWYGLFGLRSDELVLVTHASLSEDHLGIVNERLPGRVVEQYELVPTVRPRDVTPPTQSGLYVFRFFDVDPRHVDEIAQLSDTAWNTFENSAAYAAEPQALFGPRDRTRPGRMLLLTWYDGFDSWVTSRQPAPEARENFQRRRALTRGTLAYATRLLGT